MQSSACGRINIGKRRGGRFRGWEVTALASLLLGGVARSQEVAPVENLPLAATAEVDFVRDVQPLLARCLPCHGADKSEGSLRLDSRNAAITGGNRGPAIVIGQSKASRLVTFAAGINDEALAMPPEGEPLTAAEIGILRAWIDRGADWPEQTTAARRGADHWSFRPIKRPDVPFVRQEDWPRNPIDRFVLARLENEGISPSPEADRYTLVRRLYLDLIGLPPSPAEVDAFVADSRPDAYQRLVERLLADPHYGERWARRWLDLARYADSDGYEKDSGRPHAWRYRQWVIDALNRDVPFDRFTMYQLAGDLLPDPPLEALVATGFHRNTLTNREGGVDPEEDRVKNTIDRVNTTGTVWLGLTVGCAQCHSHKYDPLSQREYYSLLAFFNGLCELDVSMATPEQVNAFEAAKAAYDTELATLVNALTRFEKEVLPARITAWEQSLANRDELPEAVAAAEAVPAADRTNEQNQLLARYVSERDEDFKRLRQAVEDRKRSAPADPREQFKAPALGEVDPPRVTRVFNRGEFLRPGAEVSPQGPEVLPRLVVRGARPDRRDLAAWLSSIDHPLTARVTVNRHWQALFGRGLAATPEDFGVQGERPSHPELLDWLASEFVARGWSYKELCRTIVNSATYRQASNADPASLERDPFNVRLSRQQRLRVEADVVRDLALAASGLLHRAIGGPSVRPPQPAGIAELTYAGSASWPESQGPDRYRRGLYTWFQRTSPFPMLMTFDSPDSTVACTRRERSNTPLQALTLLNDPTFVECAQHLAARVLQEVAAGAREPDALHRDRIALAFRLCLGRPADAEELAELTRLWQAERALAPNDPEALKNLLGIASFPSSTEPADAAAWVALARALLNLDEFIVRE